MGFANYTGDATQYVIGDGKKGSNRVFEKATN